MINGTGQKRRFTSKSGIFCVLSVRTGEVLNYDVLSEVCFECRANEAKGKDNDEFRSWCQKHERICPVNHTGANG